MDKKLIFVVVLGVLLVGSFFLFNTPKENIEHKLNTCEPIVYRGDSIINAVERYEKQDCFEGYELSLEVKE